MFVVKQGSAAHREPARMLARVVISTAVAVLLGGCRDFVLDDGSRVGDHHILRGRAASNLTSTEIAARSFVSRTRDLAPLEAVLAESLDGRVVLSGSNSEAFADGTVTRFDARMGAGLSLAAGADKPIGTH